MRAFTYILLCHDNTLYTGWTVNIEKRLEAHNSGKGAKYTRTRLPVKLVYLEEFQDKSTAQRRECEIKNLCRTEKIALIKTQGQAFS